MARKAAEKPVKKIPSSENGHATKYTSEKGTEYLVTQNSEKKQFTLWKISPDGYLKIDTAKSPLDLYAIVEAL